MAIKSTFRNMVLSLGLITLLCGVLLAFVHSLTEKPIERAAEAKVREAVSSVLPPADSVAVCNGEDGTSYYIGLDKNGNVVGYVVNASSIGFGGQLRLMAGFRPDGTVYGVSVLEHSETPGLGAKCTDESFCGQFCGFNPAVSTLSVRKDGGDVDAITASTITSRAFCAAMENAVRTFRSLAPSCDNSNVPDEEQTELQQETDADDAPSETMEEQNNE